MLKITGLASVLAMSAVLASVSLPAAAADTFRYGVVEAKGDAGILFMPEKFGAKNGIDLKILQFKSSTMPVKALISGDLDAFAVSPGVALVAMEHGAAIKFVGCNWSGASYDLYGAPDIKTVADLKGKPIAASGPGSMPDIFTREALTAKGLDPSQVTFANAGGGADRVRALLAGVVKATATSPEFEPEAKKYHLNILARARDVTPLFARNCIVTTDAIIQKKHDLLVRFLATVMEGTGYALTHRAETIALSHKIANLPANNVSAAYIFDQVVADKDVDPKLSIPMKKLQWIEGMLEQHGKIAGHKDVTPYVDDAPRQDALKLVAKAK